MEILQNIFFPFLTTLSLQFPLLDIPLHFIQCLFKKPGRIKPCGADQRIFSVHLKYVSLTLPLIMFKLEFVLFEIFNKNCELTKILTLLFLLRQTCFFKCIQNLSNIVLHRISTGLFNLYSTANSS